MGQDYKDIKKKIEKDLIEYKKEIDVLIEKVKSGEKNIKNYSRLFELYNCINIHQEDSESKDNAIKYAKLTLNCIDEHIKNNTVTADMYNLASYIYDYFGDFNNAIENLNKAIEIEENVTYYYHRYRLYKKNHCAEALSDYEKIIALKPEMKDFIDEYNKSKDKMNNLGSDFRNHCFATIFILSIIGWYTVKEIYASLVSNTDIIDKILSTIVFSGGFIFVAYIIFMFAKMIAKKK